MKLKFILKMTMNKIGSLLLSSQKQHCIIYNRLLFVEEVFSKQQ